MNKQTHTKKYLKRLAKTEMDLDPSLTYMKALHIVAVKLGHRSYNEMLLNGFVTDPKQDKKLQYSVRPA